MPILELPDVTLVAVFTVAHELTLRAVDECTSRARFGDVKLFTDRDIGLRYVRCGPFANLAEAGRFTTYTVPKHIATSHALFIHWDSWVRDPASWRPEFLDVDYIGAVWHWHREGGRVGNSGFCLRSKRLLDFIAENEQRFPVGDPEDLTLCQEYRPHLERLGFRWASEALAHQFSFERSWEARSPFGYHGLFNWPSIMSDAEIEDRLRGAPVYVTESGHFKEMQEIMRRRSSPMSHARRPDQFT